MAVSAEAVREIAHHMALLPLAWLGLRRPRAGVAFWWLAVAFGVSWMADSVSHLISPWIASFAYPVTQASLVGAVLLERRDAIVLTVCLGLVGIASVAWEGVHGPDLLLRTAAWGSVAVVAYERKALGWLRLSLLVTFGLGLFCWIGYAAWPGWPSWLCYQGARLAGILLFCAAAMHPVPRLRLEVMR